MLASRIIAPYKVEVADVDKPQLIKGTVQVKMKIGTLCGSDVHFYKTPRPENEYPLPAGFSGHECVGVVEASDSNEFERGDPVLIVPHSIEAFTGFVEYIVLPPENLLRLPPDMKLEELVVGQQLGTVIYCCRKLPNPLDMDVVVLGQGAAGLLFTSMIKNMGARTIIGIDLVSNRLEVAHRMGATHVIDASKIDPVEAVFDITNGGMVDLAVEATGELDAINQIPNFIREFGHIVLFGIGPYGNIPFDYMNLFRQHPTVISSSRTFSEKGYRSFKLAMEFIAQKRIDVNPLLSHRLPLQSIDKAYDLAFTKRNGAVKILIDFEG